MMHDLTPRHDSCSRKNAFFVRTHAVLTVCLFLLFLWRISPYACAAETTEPMETVFPDPEKWNASRTLSCGENLPGCLLLQSVMTGSLGAFDSEDALVRRVYSAMYPQMCAVTEDDLAHFCEEFDEKKQPIQSLYYKALANCLYAMFLVETAPDEDTANAWRVLKLFLDPSREPDGEEQLRRILDLLDDASIRLLAQAAGTGEDFIRWLADQSSPSSGLFSSSVPGSTNLPSLSSGTLDPSLQQSSTQPSWE